MHVGGIFCDLTKAFDCVNYEILLAKFHFYGIQDSFFLSLCSITYQLYMYVKYL
jgi:hypothetical protein